MFMRMLNRTLAYRCPFKDEFEFCVSLGDHNDGCAQPGHLHVPRMLDLLTTQIICRFPGGYPGIPVLVNARKPSEPSTFIPVPTCYFGGWPGGLLSAGL